MATDVGYGTISFGSVIAGVYKTSDSVTYDGKSVAEVECTVDTDTVESYVAGDTPAFGQLKCTILVDSTLDLDGVVGTTEVLTWTTTQGKTIVGSAFLVSGVTTGVKNDIVKASLVFRYAGATTTTPTA